MQNEQLDQSIVNLARAIGKSESGGDYNAKGQSGEFGAYQFMPATWKTWAKKHLGNENAEMSKENQDKVAYSQIKEWGSQGYKPAQIASLWNSGKPDWEGNVGVNKMGVKYDTPSYVKKVGQTYESLTKGESSESVTTPSTVQPTKQPQEKPKLLGSETLGNVAIGLGRSALSLADDASRFGDWFARNTMGRVISAVEGKGFTAPEASNSLASLVGGKERLKELETPTNVTQSVSKTAGNIIFPLAATAGMGLLSKVMTPASSALKSKQIMGLLAKDTGIDATKLSATQIADSLSTAIGSRSLTGSTKILAQKAFDEVAPLVLKEHGIGKGAIKGVFSFLEKHPIARFMGIEQISPIVKNILVGMYEKYVGSQLQGPGGGSIQINPAP